MAKQTYFTAVNLQREA